MMSRSTHDGTALASQHSPGNSGYRHIDTITGLFVAVLLISNVASTKILDFGWFTFDGGTLLFPLSYVFGDILTEVYGYARSRKVIWLGFFSAALMSATFAIVSALPPAQGWANQVAFEKILGMTPRIVCASLAGYWAGEFANSFVLAKMKVLTDGRWLWTRTIGSTLVGEAVDTALFATIAFAGGLDSHLLLTLIISNYVFKCGVEIVGTPVTYAVVKKLKREEQVDWYDRGTDFNPFRISSAGPEATPGS
jgi:uncharacterized integral membrane protein (TIGR00697 family)